MESFLGGSNAESAETNIQVPARGSAAYILTATNQIHSSVRTVILRIIVLLTRLHVVSGERQHNAADLPPATRPEFRAGATDRIYLLPSNQPGRCIGKSLSSDRSQ